jgi:AcrR family transcriptional regulator
MTGEVTPRPRGRRPGATESRQAILAAARSAFERDAYAKATLRGIAREAGVDVALIGHFFGSKAGLFVAATDWPFDPQESVAAALAGGPHDVGRRLAEFFFDYWASTNERRGVLVLFETAFSSDTAAALLREFFTTEVFTPLLTALGADQVQLRAGLMGSQLQGIVFSRYVLALLPPDEVDDATVVAAIAPTLQRYATGDIG